MKNKYINHSHISEKKFREVLKHFSKDFTAEQTAGLTNISRISVNRLYAQFRIRISELLRVSGNLDGEVEVDESYFGARRVRGKRGRGAQGKVPVVGLLKRHGKVYTQIISNLLQRGVDAHFKRQDSLKINCLHRWLEII